jgi:hypothetical protein
MYLYVYSCSMLHIWNRRYVFKGETKKECDHLADQCVDGANIKMDL